MSLMDFLYANYVLETAIADLSSGEFSDASRGLTDFVEAIRFNVADKDRSNAAKLIKRTRKRADGGEWQNLNAKAKMYKMAGAKKAGERAHAKAHASTVNPPKYEAAPETKGRKEPTTLPSMKAVGHVGTEPQRDKKPLAGVPMGWHAAGFVDPHDPHVQAQRKADSDYFKKWSSPPAGSGPSKKKNESGSWKYKSVVKKTKTESAASNLNARLAFLYEKDES